MIFVLLNFRPYATTSLIGQFSNNFANNKNTYSAPNSVHYNNFEQVKMNIIENKMENILNNFNSPSRVIVADNKQVMDGELCTINSRGSRNRLRTHNSHGKNYSDKINVGDAHTWSTYQSTSQSQTNSPAHFPQNIDNSHKNNSQIYLSSFGRIDKV